MKLSPARTKTTESRYRNRYRALARKAARATGLRTEANVFAVVNWFTGQNGRWATATVRQYRASIMMWLEDLTRAKHLDANRAERIHELLEDGPRPKASGERRQTSSKKRKTASKSEWKKVVRRLGEGDWWDLLAARFILVNLSIGARPSELETAVLDRKTCTLTIENAKNSNGRSFGPTRTLDLTPVCERCSEFFDLVDRFLANLQSAYADLADWSRIRSRIADRMARACRLLGIGRLSPYATRHQAIAAAKASGSTTEVAAFAGHASDRTATVHYARRSRGRKVRMEVASPSPHEVALVRRHYKTRHPFYRDIALTDHPAAAENEASPDGLPQRSGPG